MMILQEPCISEESQCAYLPEKQWRFEYFFATEIDEEELNILLENGWRKFGTYYFRPSCKNCKKCVPLRVCTNFFSPSKSQKRIVKKNSDTTIFYNELTYSDDVYNIYKDHSMYRFNKITTKDEFIMTFYTKSCVSMQSEYYIDKNLSAAGFLDIASHGLSSVYFVYKQLYNNYRLGTFSIINEIEYAKLLKLDYYYLGYYIEENKSMSYKNRFHPFEIFNWDTMTWKLHSFENK